MTELQAKTTVLWFLGLGVLLFSVRTHLLPAKDKKPKGTTPPEITFRVNVNLVSVNVNVTDKQGLPITDLREKDLQILDNGVPQKIAVFRVETIPGTATPVPNQGPNTPAPPAPTAASRKVILFVDDYNTSFENLVYVRKAGEQFIRTSLGPTDFVALITASGQFSTEFTKSREQAIANLNQVMPVLPGSSATWNMGDFVKKRIFFSLQTLARRLQAINGPKELIFLSPGFFLTQSPDLSDIAHIQQIIDDAIHADTVIDSVNTAGLAPDYSAASRTPPGNPGVAQSAMESPLSALASGTGGKLFHNSNDLFGIMAAAIRRSSVNYILGFYPSDERYDGQFHTLVVKVDRPGVSTTARNGYFAPKGEESLESMSSERIRNVLDNSLELKDVPVSLSLSTAHEETLEPLVAVQTRIDVKTIHFRNVEKRNQNSFTIVTIIYDSSNQFVDGREAHLDLNLTDQHYQDVLKTGLVWKAQFKLPSGHYMVKTAVLEAGEDKMGSAFKALDISD